MKQLKIAQCENPRCNKLLTSADDICILDVELGMVKRKYTYCSKKHLDDILANLNRNTLAFELRVKIVESIVISERTPFHMKVVLKEEPFDYRLLIGGK